jgi:hypothetical protein
MAEPKDKFGLDIPVPKPPAGKREKGDGKVKTKLPRGYKAAQKPGLYRRIKARAMKKKERMLARYEGPSVYSKIYEEHKQRMLEVVTKFLTDELGVIAEWLKDMTSMRKKLRKTLNYHAILTAGVVLVLIGIATYLECICPQIYCGLSFAIVGLAAIIIALIYRRSY